MEIETTTKTAGFERPHIEEGYHVAELKEVKDISEGKHGPRVAFVYRIVEHDVEIAYVAYKVKATKDNKLGKALIAHGLEIADGKINTDPLIGSKVRVMVEDYTYEPEDGKVMDASTITKVKTLAEKP